MRLFFTDGDRVLSIETRREWYYFEDKRQNKNTPIIRISPEDLENIERECDFNGYGETWHDKGDTIPCSLDDLRPEEITELKQSYYIDRHPEGVSYGELADVDRLVTMDELREEYGSTIFTPEDFLCNTAGALT